MPIHSESGSLTPIEGDSPALGDYSSPRLKPGATRPPNPLFSVSHWFKPGWKPKRAVGLRDIG